MRAPQSAVVACVVSLVACTASAPPVDTAADAEAIRQIIAGYQEGLNNGDLAQSVAMYAADAVFMPNLSPPQVGLPAIRRFYEETILSNQYETDFVTTDVQVAGDVAWATVAISGRQTPSGGAAFSFESKALFVLSRAESGSWEVIRYIFNHNS